jgi:putative ABC transport system permease protein
VRDEFVIRHSSFVIFPMSPLDLKLLRDLGKMKGQTAAVALVMGCGLAMMIMARSLIFSLESARDSFYDQNRFATVFADLKRAPNDVRSRLAQISGLGAIETRATGRITLDLPDLPEPADGVAISLPDNRPQQLDLLFLRTGRLPESGARGEVVVSEAFADTHHFEPGNRIAAILRGQRQTLTIVGIALSPEYVFEARPGDTLPDNRRFGVFWMNERELSTALDLHGAFNNVTAALAPGQAIDPVLAELDRILAPYGALGAYGRKDQPSAVRLNDELRVLHGFAFAFPAAFLSIAAFMSSAVVTRLIRLQREQIAQLKAFGYSSRQVGWHYLKFALVIVSLGTILGCFGGISLGRGVVHVYHRFFRFPVLHFATDRSALMIALIVSAGAAFIGVLGAVRQAARLPPAEAMRPEPPADFKPSFLERIGLTHLVSTSMKMALRNLERKPWQALFTALGIGLAAGIPIIPGAMREGIEYLLSFQWDVAERQDVTVSLVEPGSASALSDLRHLPGVMLAEPFRSVPGQLRFGHRSRKLGVSGIGRDAILNRLLDAQGRPVALPPDGIIMSAKLAEILGAQPGDHLRLEVEEGERPVRDVLLAGTFTDYAGVSAYMEIDNLRRLMREGDTVSGAYLSVDMHLWDRFLAKVKETPRIATLMIKDAVRQSFKKTTAESISLLQTLYFSFSVVVSFGVVYNSARIALSERTRDLATLRVIGFTKREVAGVLISELATLTILALPIGLAFGSAMASFIIHAASTETIRLPLILSTHTYATATLIVVVSASFSFAVVSRRIHNLDLLGVLKARD